VIFKSFELEVTGNDFFCLFSNSGKSLLHLFFLCNTHVASNKSSLLLKLQKLNVQTVQLFTKIIKTESVYKNN
jgi:hypothetical protein